MIRRGITTAVLITAVDASFVTLALSYEVEEMAMATGERIIIDAKLDGLRMLRDGR
jgi:hypothetical protein